MAENNFKLVVAQVRMAGLKVFRYRKYEEVFREVVDLVFLCDATGGMENNGVFDQARSCCVKLYIIFERQNNCYPSYRNDCAAGSVLGWVQGKSHS